MQKSESETLISECNSYPAEVPKMLTEYSLVAYALIQQGQYHQSLELLSQSEELLEAVTSQGGSVDLDFILLTVHNSAYCYSKLGMLTESMSYVDACIFNSESKKVLGPDLSGTAPLLSSLKKEKYECGVHLSFSSSLASALNHEQSLKHSKIALKKGLNCMRICYKICVDHLSRHSKLMNTDSIRKRLNKHFQYNLIQSPHYQSYHKLVQQAMPFLQYFYNKYYSSSSKVSKLNLKSAFLLFYSEDEPVLSATLDEITELKPLNPSVISTALGIFTEISKENLIQKILVIIASMYNIANELKFSPDGKEKAKVWLKKTIKNAQDLLPQHCMILKQLKESYVREYNKLDFFSSKKRQNTVSFRTRTPVPITIHKPWNHHQSGFDKEFTQMKLNIKSKEI